MPVFKTYMKIVKKNTFVAIMYIAVFILLTFLFSSNLSHIQTSFEDIRLGVSIIDEDNTEASAAFTAYIASKNIIIDIANDKDEILDALYYTKTDYVLTIKEGFEEKLAKGETEGLLTNYQVPDSFDGVYVDNSIDRYISVLSAYIAGGDNISDALTKTGEALAKETDVRVENFNNEVSDNANYPIRTQFFFTYLPYGLLSALISILSTVLIKINKKEVMYRANCSSTTAFSQTAQILLGSIVLVMITWVVFMIAGMLCNGGVFTGKCWLAVLNSFVFILVAAGIAILISTLKNSTRSIAMIANIISLGMSFLCGIFVEQALFGEKVLSVARFLPAYWYIKANDMLMFAAEDAFNSTEFMTCIGIEALFAVALFAVILLVSKTKHNAK